MSAEPKPHIETEDEPFVWDGPGTVRSIRYFEDGGAIIDVDLTDKELWGLFDVEVQRLLGISADEFVRKLDAGEYGDDLDDPDHWELMHLAIRRP